MANKYRYVTDLDARPDDCLDRFNLISRNMLKRHHAAIRVTIPADVRLCKFYERANWSVTMHAKSLRSYDPVPMLLIDGKWQIRQDLWPRMRLDAAVAMLKNQGYVLTESHGLVDRNKYGSGLVQDADGKWRLI